MTKRDDTSDPFSSDDEFEDFLADLASGSGVTPAPVPPAPAPAPAAKPAETTFGVDYDLDFDDDDGATRVGQVPAELLAALGRQPARPAPLPRPASDARPTDRPPETAPDETEVEMDDFGDLDLDKVESLAPPIGTRPSDAPLGDQPTIDLEGDRPTLDIGEPGPVAAASRVSAPPPRAPSRIPAPPPRSSTAGASRASAPPPAKADAFPPEWDDQPHPGRDSSMPTVPPNESGEAVGAAMPAIPPPPRTPSAEVSRPTPSRAVDALDEPGEHELSIDSRGRDAVPLAPSLDVAITTANDEDEDDDGISIDGDDDAEIVMNGDADAADADDDDDDDDDGISIDGEGDEVILDGDDGDDDVHGASVPAPIAAAAPSIAPRAAPVRAAPPVSTLAGRELLDARARMLAQLAADLSTGPAETASAHAAEAFVAAAELGERAQLADSDAWLESAALGTGETAHLARRISARRGRRAVTALTRGSLGRDVAAVDALLEAVTLARSGESPLSALERATSLARSSHLRRLAASAAADVATKAGDGARAATLRLSTLGDDQPAGESLRAARELRALASRSGLAEALAHGASRANRPEVANALGRWARATVPAQALLGSVAPDDGSAASVHARLASPPSTTSTTSDHESAFVALAALGDADDRANQLARAAERAAARGDYELARTRFEEARRATSRSAFVDALRDVCAARLADTSRLGPTPVHDDDDAPIAALGRACIDPEITEATWRAIVTARELPRVAATADRLAADVAANLGEPTEWVLALERERRGASVGASGIDIARALVFARAGDREAALAAIPEGTPGYGAAALALLQVANDPRGAAGALAAVEPSTAHDRALRTRFDSNGELALFEQALAESKGDPFIALRLEQSARRASNATAELCALDVLAGLADDPTERTKLRLLAAAGNDLEGDTLELAPEDPVLLAEALLGRTVDANTRDRALARLGENATPFILATLRARAATLAEIDGSLADAALQLRAAHEAVPNEPSLRVGLELAELAAEQSVRVAHRLFAVARSDADPRTRARAYARLAELDRREVRDPSAALASLRAVLELAPNHVPTLRGLEAIARDRNETGDLPAIEERLAASLAPGRAADAHARLAIRHAFAEAQHPTAAVRGIALGALARGTQSTRLLRWAEHAARQQPNALEITALEGRVRGTEDDAERIELLARIATHAQRRGDLERARAAFDRAFDIDPAHPAIAIERATLLDAIGDSAAAGPAHEAAAATCRTNDRAVAHLMRAAEHYEHVGSPERARALLELAYEREPAQAFVLEALALAHERWSDPEAALATIERRIELGGTPEELLVAHRKRASLAERIGRLDIARAAYVDVLAIEATDHEVLRRAAELAIEAEDGRVAVDMLIRLARVEQDAGELARIFRALGDCYERLSPDPRRAEASYRRVVQMEPTDAVSNDRLASLLVAQARFDDALVVVDALGVVSPLSTLVRDLYFRTARGLEATGDARRAEAILESVRKDAPTDPAVVLEMARFYERQDAKPALSMHLGRAAADLRRAFEDNPSQAPLEGLLEVHRLRGRADALACAAATATTLGLATGSGPERLTSTIEGAGKRANDREVDEIVAPRSLPEGTREALRMGGDAIDKAYPFDARPFKTEKLGKEVPIRSEALRVAEWFGFDDVVILVTAAAPRICVPVSASPFTIVMGRELPLLTSELEREFLFVRSAKIAAAGLSFAMRLQGPQVAQAVFALVRSHDATYAPPGVDPTKFDEAARIIAKHTTNMGELGALCMEMSSRPSFEPHRFGIAAAEWSDRVALVATGQIEGGVSSLLRLGGHDLESASTFDERLRIVRSMPEAWGLLAFSLSDAHAEARVRAGVSRG